RHHSLGPAARAVWMGTRCRNRSRSRSALRTIARGIHFRSRDRVTADFADNADTTSPTSAQSAPSAVHLSGAPHQTKIKPLKPPQNRFDTRSHDGYVDAWISPWSILLS